MSGSPGAEQCLFPAALSLIRLLEKLDQLRLVHGFEQIVASSSFEGIQQSFLGRMPSYEQNLRGSVPALRALKQLNPVDAGHFKVREQYVDSPRFDPRQSLL